MGEAGRDLEGNRLDDAKIVGHRLEEAIFIPFHELLHCYAAHWLGVPAFMQDSAVYYFNPGKTKDLLITLAPLIFSLLFLLWAVYSFIFLSAHTPSAVAVFIIQSWFAVRHLELCRFDLIDAFHQLKR